MTDLHPTSRRKRVARIALMTLAALSVALVAGATVAYLRYPGMTVRMFETARTTSLTESRNLFLTMSYWVETMEQLRFDEGTGTWDFRTPVALDGMERCRLDYHRGDFAHAARCVEAEIERGGASRDELFWLGMARMRRAEEANCLEHRGPRSCTLPLVAPHQRRGMAEDAADAFRRLLDEHDPGDPLARWLLNFNHMTAGTFPQGVPARYRLDTPFIDAFYGETRRRQEERYGRLRFVDRAAELGVDTLDTGRGVAVEDFDRDGYLDLVTGGAFDHLRFYRNVPSEGGRRFEEATDETGLGGVTQPFAISGADFDDDGWVDLFVARPFDHYRLFRNVRGRFVDVTEETGLLAAKGADEVAASWAAAWGDVDLDGDLDLFLAQWGMQIPFTEGLLHKPRMDSRLFLNDRDEADGTTRFVDATAAWGLEPIVADEYFIGASFGDFDGDGDPDLFLSSPAGQATTLLENRLETGAGFRPVDASKLPERDERGFFSAFVDIDHDGRLDIFQGGFSDARTSTETAVLGDPEGRYRSGRSTVLRQKPDGSFEARDDFFGGDLTMPMATMGASYGDLDLDGCHDFYLGTGNPESWFVLPNQMLVGVRDGRRCTGRMDNVSMLEGFGTIQKGHSPLFFDFDEDGDQDVYSSLGGMWPTDAWPNQLFVNESDLGEASWVKLRLRGRRTNRHGVGARIAIHAQAPDGSPIVRRLQMDNKTGFGSAPYLAHVGLLDAERIRAVEIYWPVSRCRHRYPARLNRLNVLDEALCGDRPEGQQGGPDA